MSDQEKVIKYYQTLWANVRNGSNIYENPETETAFRYGDFAGIGKLVSDFLIKHPYEHKSILSLGCGSGEELLDIQNTYPKARIIGVDTSSDALYKSRTNSNISLVNASAFHLPFNQATRFDGIVAGQFFDFFAREELEDLFRELSSYTDRESRLYVAIYGRPEENDWLNSLSEFGAFLSQNKEWKIINWELYSKPELSPYAKGIFIVGEKL